MSSSFESSGLTYTTCQEKYFDINKMILDENENISSFKIGSKKLPIMTIISFQTIMLKQNYSSHSACDKCHISLSFFGK